MIGFRAFARIRDCSLVLYDRYPQVCSGSTSRIHCWLGTSEALHVMRTDPQIASRFQSCALPSWTANDDLRSFLAGFLQQLDVDGKDIVNNRIAIDHILELTSGVTGRIVELVRLSARCAVRRDSRTVTVDLLQEAGNEFAADDGSERNVSH